jgi:hypothetical protein
VSSCLDGLDNSHGGRWRCPHVFHCREGEEGAPPRGWTQRTLRVPHASAGGSTDAVWVAVHWSPPGVPPPLEPHLRRKPWTPLRSRLDSMVRAAPFPAPLLTVELAPAVILLAAAPDVVVPEGLFPHDLPSHQVLAPCTLSRTGFCMRSLGDQELWGLCGVPILFQDLALLSSEQASSLSAAVGLAPAKVLQLGGKCLLAGILWGGCHAPRSGMWSCLWRSRQEEAGPHPRDFPSGGGR